jgi:hypothetical protein
MRPLLVVALLALCALPAALRSTSAVHAADDIVCGEAKTISVTVKDAAGQPVSDHTRVEFVTNYGGVLAGTTATLDPLAPGYVAPLSSTTAETFNGVASVVLITSTEHIGAYEVVASTGGSIRAAGLPQPPIYAPGGSMPNVSAYIPRPAYGYVYVPSGPPVTAQVTVVCRAP